MHRLGPKIHLKSPLAPQPVHWNLIKCDLLRAHSPRIYARSFPNLLCLYLRACAFGKWWGVPSENARVGDQNPSEITLSTPAGTTEAWFNATFWGPILRVYTTDHSHTFCAYTAGHVRLENGGGGGRPSENARVGAQNPSEFTLSTPAGTTETWFNATFKGPILREYTS